MPGRGRGRSSCCCRAKFGIAHRTTALHLRQPLAQGDQFERRPVQLASLMPAIVILTLAKEADFRSASGIAAKNGQTANQRRPTPHAD